MAVRLKTENKILNCVSSTVAECLQQYIKFENLELDHLTSAGVLGYKTFPPTSITGHATTPADSHLQSPAMLPTPLQLTLISCKSSRNVCRQVLLDVLEDETEEN